MFRKILRMWENSSLYIFIKDIESIFFDLVSIKDVKAHDPNEHLKKYSLEVIRGIGPKITMKLVNFGINNPHDLINCPKIPGISESRLNNWKQSALAL